MLRAKIPYIWILHELEASIGKALKSEVIVKYALPLITSIWKPPIRPLGENR